MQVNDFPFTKGDAQGNLKMIEDYLVEIYALIMKKKNPAYKSCFHDFFNQCCCLDENYLPKPEKLRACKKVAETYINLLEIFRILDYTINEAVFMFSFLCSSEPFTARRYEMFLNKTYSTVRFVGLQEALRNPDVLNNSNKNVFARCVPDLKNAFPPKLPEFKDCFMLDVPHEMGSVNFADYRIGLEECAEVEKANKSLSTLN